MCYKFDMFTTLLLLLFISITDARQILGFEDFAPCLISLNHFGNKSQIFNDLIDQVLGANRLSILKISIFSLYPPKIEEAEPLAKCTLYVIFIRKNNAGWMKIEKSILASTFAYRSDYASSIILFRLRQFSKPKLTGCAYKRISIRIFSLAVTLSYHRKITNIEWSFYCYFCSGKSWIGVAAKGKMSDFVRLNHLTLRDKFDQEKTFFYIETVPAPPRKRIIECQYSIWWIPKKPCHPNQMVQDVLTSQLNVTFRNIKKSSDNICGLLHLNVILTSGAVVRNATGSLKLRQAIVSRFRYCKFGKSLQSGKIQFWA